MSLVPTAVFLLVTKADENFYGATISSLICTSLNGPKPTIAITLSIHSNSLIRIEENRKFCLNLLSDSHSMVASTFSEKSSNIVKYETLLSKGTCGYLHFKNAITTLCCNLVESKKINDNKIIFANVENYVMSESTASSRVLAYHRRSYLKL